MFSLFGTGALGYYFQEDIKALIGSNPCKEVVCKNGGNCNDGNCDCQDGFFGSNCQEMDLSKVQSLLAYKTPIDLFKAGVPLESLYGKMYKGGLIFFIDTLNKYDFSGMVAAPKDQGVVKWGCDQELKDNDPHLPPLGDLYPYLLSGRKASQLGAARKNTENLIALCLEENTPAKLCKILGDDWLLPSFMELNLMNINLHQKGHGEFAAELYWSSTVFFKSTDILQYGGISHDFGHESIRDVTLLCELEPDCEDQAHVRAVRFF